MTEELAEHLIKMLKKVVDNKDVIIPQLGDKTYVNIEPSKEVDCSDKFLIQIFKSKRDLEKCSFSAMYLPTKEQLLRIDVGGAPHTNPDGTKISGNHMHIFVDGNEVRYAMEFDTKNKNLVQIAIEFLKKFNVIDPLPNVYHYTTLFS